MRKKPIYTYEKRGSWWAIYEWKHNKKGSIGTKIKDWLTFEQANDEVYRLNGWNKKETVHG